MNDEEELLPDIEDELDSAEEEELSGELEQEEVVEDNVPDEQEEKAKKYGHLSKEEWVAQGRNPSLWKSPTEFNKTGEVIEQIYSLKKQVEQRDRELRAVIAQQDRIAKREYERARQEVELQLAHAKDDMDVEGVARHTEQLVQLKQQEAFDEQKITVQKQQQAKDSFIERNQHWFNERNSDLMQRAVDIDNEIQREINAGRLQVSSYDDIGVMIEKRLEYEYPERVLRQTQNVRPHVSATTSSVNKSSVNMNNTKKTFQGLSQDHKDTFSAFKRIKASLGEELTEAEFIEQLKADGEI